MRPKLPACVAKRLLRCCCSALLFLLSKAEAPDSVGSSGVVGVVPTVLIISQSLYFGAAAGLRKNNKKWRHHSKEKRVLAIFLLIFLASAVQTAMMFFRDSDDHWANALMTAGPLPILPPAVALMMYPLAANRMRHKYRKNTALWDTRSGSSIPIRIVVNTWWKWVIYLCTGAGTVVITSMAYRRSGNLYPLLSSLALPMLTIVLGAGMPFSRKIEEIQSDCRGNCTQDVIIAPVIGYSNSTSLIVLTYKKNESIHIERLQSILEHTNFAHKNQETIKTAFAEKFLDSESDDDVTRFIEDAKKLIDLVTSIGGWFSVSEAFLKKKSWIRQSLENENVYNEYNTMMYCWNRAILESAIRNGCSKHKLEYDQNFENIHITTIGDLFNHVLQLQGQVGNVEIMDVKGGKFRPDQVARMMGTVTDMRGAFVVAALLLDRMARSRDARSRQLITLAKGYDIAVTFRIDGQDTPGVDPYSKDISLDNSKLHEAAHRQDEKLISAPARIREICQEPPTISAETMYERISAEFVPMNWTSFYMHRQHMLMYLLIYMALAVVFVVFGQTQTM